MGVLHLHSHSNTSTKICAKPAHASQSVQCPSSVCNMPQYAFYCTQHVDDRRTEQQGVLLSRCTMTLSIVTQIQQRVLQLRPRVLVRILAVATICRDCVATASTCLAKQCHPQPCNCKCGILNARRQLQTEPQQDSKMPDGIALDHHAAADALFMRSSGA